MRTGGQTSDRVVSARLWILTVGLAGLMLMLFVVFEAVGPAGLNDPSSWQDSSRVVVAVGSVALLAIDVVLPVPSSVVMVANGALFGFLVGAALSTLGATVSAVIGFGIGRMSSSKVDAWLRSSAAGRLDDLVARFGTAAVIGTRPVPIVAEVVAVLAGAGRMPFGRFVAATLIGNAAMSMMYALAGAAYAGLENGWMILAGSLVVAGVVWFVGRRFSTEEQHSDAGSHPD